MRFIVDAQLPVSLSEFLKSKGYDSLHTMDLPDKNRTSDKQIVTLAQIEQRVIITKDNDFLESFLVLGKPSKLILVKTGNMSNTILIDIFSNHLEKITSLLLECSLIEINKNELVVHT